MRTCVCVCVIEFKVQPPAVLTNLICLNYRPVDLSSHDPYNTSFYTQPMEETHTHIHQISFISLFPFLITLSWYLSLFIPPSARLLRVISATPSPNRWQIQSLSGSQSTPERAFPPVSRYVFQSGKFSHKTSPFFSCPSTLSLFPSPPLSLSLSFSRPSGLTARLSYRALQKLLNVLLLELINSKDTINWKICSELKKRLGEDGYCRES